jgi:peptidoglycan/xylan/chitin deacetylase (PgdA/CDA1 family)
VARAWQVASRFGIGAGRMGTRLMAYRDLVAEYGGRPSLPITAVVLDRNPQVARRLTESGVELCVHGLIHTDMAMLSRETQEEHIRRALRLFANHGIEARGFRSPYLKYNAGTIEAVQKLGFEYDSNLPFYWEPVESLRGLSQDEADGLRRGLRFYSPVKYPSERSLPRFIGRIVEIPVSLPDDEILLDRMGLPVDRIGDVWMEMAERALERGEMFVVQLHPERILHLEQALRRVLRFTREGGRFWLATMNEIARWWVERTQAEVRNIRLGGDMHRVGTASPIRLGLKVVEPLSGVTAPLGTAGEVRSGARPVIGIGEKASVVLRRNIRELGYFYDITTDRESVNLYVDQELDMDALRAMIGRCSNPLLADSRWPEPFEAAMAVTGDIDCLTLGDFLRRFKEG